MKRHPYRLGTFALGLAALIFSPSALLAQQEAAAEQNAGEDDIVVQARGPIHEAYAEPTQAAREPGLIVPKKPPDPIPEQPPDQRPAGDNVQWIPGYWAWDLDRKDFLWVSGFWRALPEGRKWVPGYWSEVEDGYQWVPGFWADATQDRLQYLEEPPASIDNGPDTPAPDDDSLYVPGCWVYRSTRYAWRPGFWMAARPGRVWIEDHYCYTPSGYVFVNGYWDYPLEDRGLPFAPVVFNQPLWDNPDWVYQPSYCLNYSSLLPSLFVQPNYCHYFFGDYYGPSYSRFGFSPWFVYGRRFHDPLFSYYHWRHRGDPGWYRGLRNTFMGRLHGTLPRPPRTLFAQNRLLRDRSIRNVNSLRMVHSLHQVNNRLRLTRVNRSQVNRLRSSMVGYRNILRERQRAEGAGRSLAGRRSPFSLSGLPHSARPSPQARPHAVHQFPQRPYRREGTARKPTNRTTPSRTYPTRPYTSDRSGRLRDTTRPSTRPYRSTPRYGSTRPTRPAYRPTRPSSIRPASRSSTYRSRPRSPSRTYAAPRSTYRPTRTPARSSYRPSPTYRRSAPRTQPRTSSRPAPTYRRSAPRTSSRPTPTYRRSAPRPQPRTSSRAPTTRRSTPRPAPTSRKRTTPPRN
jgi:hypothetical protein